MYLITDVFFLFKCPEVICNIVSMQNNVYRWLLINVTNPLQNPRRLNVFSQNMNLKQLHSLQLASLSRTFCRKTELHAILKNTMFKTDNWKIKSQDLNDKNVSFIIHFTKVFTPARWMHFNVYKNPDSEGIKHENFVQILCSSLFTEVQFA